MLMCFFLLLACSEQSNDIPKSPPAAQSSPAQSDAPRIIILGDSLTAGLGLAVDQAYPTLLSNQLSADGMPTEILNAGVSGDTTAGGLRRVDWLLKQQPDLLVIELGANDGMRGTPVDEIRSNLSQIIEKVKTAGVEVWLMQMMVPPNYGAEYANSLSAIYPSIATEKEITLLPFLLENVAGKAELNQADGIHPTSEGHKEIAATLKPHFQKWRESKKAERKLSPLLHTQTGLPSR